MRCPQCGGEVPVGASSCASCGTIFAKGKRCSYCQSVIPAAATVCPRCGRPLTANPAVSASSKATAIQPKQKGKGGFRWWNIVISLVVFLVGLFMGMGTGYNIAQSKNPAPKKQFTPKNPVSHESENSTGEQSLDSEKQKEKTKDFDGATILTHLETTQYSFQKMGFRYAFFKIKNNSPYNLRVKLDVEFFDSKGNLVGVNSLSQEAFESGQEIILYDMPDEDYERVEYKITPQEETHYDCIQSDLSYNVTEADKKIILEVTNNGEKPAEFVLAQVLFSQGDLISGFGQQYFVDEQSELKPGESIKKEIPCYDEYDSYQIFLTGRRN